MRKSINTIVVIIITLSSCSRKAFPKDGFVFDSSLYQFFQTFTSKDTLIFQNSKDKLDTFLLTRKDSIINNSKGYFINERAFKEVFISYKQIPINFWAESRVEMAGTSSERKITEDARFITITKYPDSNTTEAYISFKNFRCLIRNGLGDINRDTIKLNNTYFTNYFKLNTTSVSLLRDSSYVETIFVTLKDGFIGYKEKSGKWRVRENF